MSLKITYSQGGMQEFEKTDICPRHLLVYDTVLKKKWSRKISDKKYSGVLKLDNNIIYTYNVNLDHNEINIYDKNDNMIEDIILISELRD